MEIVRKWLVAELPDLKGLVPIRYERYFIFIGNKVETRVQKIGEKYDFERKVEVGKLSREDNRFEITLEEFEFYKSISKRSIIRDVYLFDPIQKIEIKVYHNDYEGLVRVEVEFETEEEAQIFSPLKWFGDEITDSLVGRDKYLIQMDKSQFQEYMKNIL